MKNYRSCTNGSQLPYPRIGCTSRMQHRVNRPRTPRRLRRRGRADRVHPVGRLQWRLWKARHHSHRSSRRRLETGTAETQVAMEKAIAKKWRSISRRSILRDTSRHAWLKSYARKRHPGGRRKMQRDTRLTYATATSTVAVESGTAGSTGWSNKPSSK